MVPEPLQVVRPVLELRDIPNGGMKLFGSLTPESGHHKFCHHSIENWKFENPGQLQLKMLADPV
jgi:hypothetical protein